VAIGAKLGAPERAVVAIAGDGGFLYTIEELAAAVEQGLALPVIVWDSGGYAEIADEMDRKGVPRVGVDFPSPDFLKIASGFRCHSEEPGSLDQLEAALRAALMADRPTVIRVAADASYLDQ
jgi:5-guanidino-2-oxopentanoate decarboxylase